MSWEVRYQPDKDMGIIEHDDPELGLVIQFQHGTVKENGINGVQNEQVLGLLLVRMRALNARQPCRENSLAITKMEEALMWLEHRTKLRQEQGVEGTEAVHSS